MYIYDIILYIQYTYMLQLLRGPKPTDSSSFFLASLNSFFLETRELQEDVEDGAGSLGKRLR